MTSKTAFDETTLGDRMTWFGYLTTQNAQAVGAAIVDLLNGKTYTWVAANENLDLLHPEVRTGNVLNPNGTRSGEAVTLIQDTEEKPYAHLMVHDTYGVWGMSTSVQTQKEAHTILRRDGAVGLHHMADPELKRRGDRDLVYLVLERGRKLEVHARTSAGGRVSWTIVIEGETSLYGHHHKLAIEQGNHS